MVRVVIFVPRLILNILPVEKSMEVEAEAVIVDGVVVT
jgi:hypothetical protein